jgi:hypothetical protein
MDDWLFVFTPEQISLFFLYTTLNVNLSYLQEIWRCIDCGLLETRMPRSLSHQPLVVS